MKVGTTPSPGMINYEDVLAESLRRETHLENERRSLMEAVVSYADASGVHGIKYCAGSEVTNRLVRLVWGMLFISSVAMGIVTFYPILKSFIDQTTQATTETDEMDSFDLPAITFCNMNSARKSVVGGAFASYLQFFQFEHDEDVAYDMCAAIPYYMTQPKINDTYYIGALTNVTSLFAYVGIYGMMAVVPTVYQSIQSCVFKGIKLTDEECYSAFQNRLTNRGYCFTFNPSDEIREFSTGSGDFSPNETNKEQALRFAIPTFPQPLKGLVDFNVKTRGSGSALELLINTQQYEYCNAGLKGGVGFEMQVHSRDVQPIIKELMDDVVQLSPGKEITITVEEYRTIKETESAGRCSSKVPLEYHQHLDSYQDRNACINECVTKKVIIQCDCMPEFAPATAMAQWINNFTAHTQSEQIVASFCKTLEQRYCSAYVVRSSVVENSLHHTCEHCKHPCFQRKYKVYKTENDFPAENAFSLYQDLKHPNINYTAIRALDWRQAFQYVTSMTQALDKRTYGDAEPFENINEMKNNLMHLRVQVQSMDITVYKETFAVSFSELISQLGGAISLFIGASVLSFVELLFWCMSPVWYGHRK